MSTFLLFYGHVRRHVEGCWRSPAASHGVTLNLPEIKRTFKGANAMGHTIYSTDKYYSMWSIASTMFAYKDIYFLSGHYAFVKPTDVCLEVADFPCDLTTNNNAIVETKGLSSVNVVHRLSWRKDLCGLLLVAVSTGNTP